MISIIILLLGTNFPTPNIFTHTIVYILGYNMVHAHIYKVKRLCIYFQCYSHFDRFSFCVEKSFNGCHWQ